MQLARFAKDCETLRVVDVGFVASNARQQGRFGKIASPLRLQMPEDFIKRKAFTFRVKAQIDELL
jgi:hypothetical protein